jgi:hypothetical protein
VKAVVLDAGAFIAMERRDARMLALVAELVAERQAALTPAGVVAQVWRGSPRQHAMLRLLRTGAIRAESLSEDVALRTGLLLAKTGAKDVIDGHVALIARRVRASVVTSDPDDIARLDQGLDIIPV